MFARMVPKHKSGEYFGLFNLVGRFASILGPLIVAFTVTLTGNSRVGMVGLLGLFIVGSWLLAMVKEPKNS
jgi:UMF1 family MFS transporter